MLTIQQQRYNEQVEVEYKQEMTTKKLTEGQKMMLAAKAAHPTTKPKKTTSEPQKYILKCSVCGANKRTNYTIFKEKRDSNHLGDYVCRDCKHKK